MSSLVLRCSRLFEWPERPKRFHSASTVLAVPMVIAVAVLAVLGPGCVEPPADAELTLKLLRGDADPLLDPGSSTRDPSAVDTLELNWVTPGQVVTQNLPLAPVGAGGLLSLRFEGPIPFEGRLVVRGLRATDGTPYSAGKSLPLTTSVDAPVSAPLFLGPVDAFTPVGPPMPGPRMGAALAALGSTGALMVGGYQVTDSGIELVEPGLVVYRLSEGRACGAAEGCLTGIAPPPRQDGIAIALPDGAVVHGLGRLSSGTLDRALYLTEPDGTTSLLDSGTLGPLAKVGAVALKDGTVLVVGGQDTTGPVSSVFRIDARGGAVTRMLPLLEVRANPGVALLGNGQVVVVGGQGVSNPLSTGELYSPGLGSQPLDGGAFNQARKLMRGPRVAPVLCRLADDTVVVSGGGTVAPEVFRLELGALVGGFVDLVAPPSSLRVDRPALLQLRNGELLMVGGEAKDAIEPLAVRFIPTRNQVLGPGSPTYLGTYRVQGASLTRRGEPSLVELADGTVLLAGGGTLGEPSVNVPNPASPRVELMVPMPLE